MSDKIVTLTDETFSADIKGSKEPVLVDFWAPWCGPCRMVAPVLDALADEYVGKVRIAKLNVDDNPRTTMTFGVQSIPMLMLFKNGEIVGQLIGAQPRESIKELFDRNLT
jgi:thioredoxin 1